MNHPEMLAVPALMIADYLLTIWGAKLGRVVHAKHFVMATYELNPVWRKSVDALRWLNLRHLAAVVVVTGALLLLDRLMSAADYEGLSKTNDAMELLLGILFGVFGCVCGRHLTNILLFRFLNRHPGEVSGEVRLSMLFILKLSQFTYVGLLPLFFALAVLVPDNYTFGVAVGIAVLVVIHFVWIIRAKSAARQAAGKSEITA